MRSKLALALLSIAAMALAACTSAASPSAPNPTRIAVATLTATAVPEATSSPAASLSSEPTTSPGGAAGGGQATPGSIDPCTLLTADQASKAIGKTLSAGVSTTLDPNRVCTFKNGKSEVKVILAPPAPDSKTATAYWDAARATVPQGVSIKDLPNFDRSAYGFGSAAGQSLSGLFVIDGTKVFEFYCGFPACSQAASLGAAYIIAGNLP